MPRLAPAGAQIGQGGDAETAGLGVPRRGRHVRCQQVRLVDCDQHGVRPILLGRRQQPGEEGGGLLDADVRFEVGEIEVQRQPVMPRSQGRGGEAVTGNLAGSDGGGTDMGRQVAELAFGIDDHGGGVVVRLLDQMPQRGTLAGARRSLDQAAAGEQAVEVHVQRAPIRFAERDGRAFGNGERGVCRGPKAVGARRYCRPDAHDEACRPFAFDAADIDQTLLGGFGDGEVWIGAPEQAGVAHHGVFAPAPPVVSGRGC